MHDEELQEELLSLEGLSAGQICQKDPARSFHPQIVNVIEAAFTISADPWFLADAIYVAQWSDGTTIWRSVDGSATPTVSIEGRVVTEKL